MYMNTTCQICARIIKSATGIIAHHGYKRPGGGWQTGSCAGARYLPYEVSCDRLPPTILAIKDFIQRRKKDEKEFIKNPPETLTEVFLYQPSKSHSRPPGFNVEENEKKGSYSYSSYEHEHHSQLYKIRSSIKNAYVDLIFMEKRLAAWVPPKGK